MKPYAAFGRAARNIVLHAVTGERLNPAVIHSNRQRHFDDLPRLPDHGDLIRRELQQLRGLIELCHRVFKCRAGLSSFTAVKRLRLTIRAGGSCGFGLLRRSSGFLHSLGFENTEKKGGDPKSARRVYHSLKLHISYMEVKFAGPATPAWILEVPRPADRRSRSDRTP